MAVTPDDVRHVAALARLGISAERIPTLVAELNGILAHMDVLQNVDTGDVSPVLGVGAGGTPLREDDGDPYPLAHARDTFAPAMRDGFFVVPRLATHADASSTGGAASDAEAAS